jgi:hypothetical protein
MQVMGTTFPRCATTVTAKNLKAMKVDPEIKDWALQELVKKKGVIGQDGRLELMRNAETARMVVMRMTTRLQMLETRKKYNTSTAISRIIPGP